MFVSVCVGSIRSNTLPHLVASMIAQVYSNWELIIAVQGDDQVLLSYIKHQSQQDARISYIHLQRFGRSYALNEAIKLAQGDIIAFTDDDCVAAPDWLATITDCFTQEPSVGIVAGDLIADSYHRLGISTCPATYTIECIYKPAEEHFVAPDGFYWGGANFAVRRDVLARVGPFDEYLGTGTEFPSAEDVDFGLRAEALGVSMWTTPKSAIYHTFGRRYGFKSFLKHHRSYALGSGALGGKLTLWDHRLSRVWGQKMHIRELVTRFIKNPPRMLLELYKSKYVNIGSARYLSAFELDATIRSRPK